MKKLFHCIVSHDGIKRRWVTGADYCIYCKIDGESLYKKLSVELKKEIRNLHTDIFNNNIDFFDSDCEFYNKHSNCPNGITEEELLIKDILE